MSAITSINQLDFSKLVHPIGWGYDRRPNGKLPSSLIVHTTNGNRGSSFEAEARYIQHSEAIGAHYLVGKDGRIVQFLPVTWRAWHAGATIPGFYNSDSIGIECHHAVGDSWPEAQKLALLGLCSYLVRTHRIPIHLVETHRAVATPKGRKVDPSDWQDSGATGFYQWRKRIYPRYYSVLVDKVNIRSGPTTDPKNPGSRVVAQALKGEWMLIDSIVTGETIQESNEWAHLESGLGFIWRPLLGELDAR